MATQGANNNSKAVLRRVNSSSNTGNVNFVKVDQGENPQSDKKYSEFMLSGQSVYSINNFNNDKLTKVDVRLGGIRTRAIEGGTRTFTRLKTLPDNNLSNSSITGNVGTLDIYGRVIKVSAGNLVPQTGAKGGYAFETVSTTLSADTAPGTKNWTGNLGLKYYTKMTTSKNPKTLEVFAQESEQIVSG